ncbi:MAG: hypothetical protein KBT04_06545, partial [Bacteroidales bacterium]|nr:hypothetical protein [Candidatus Colimorpha onthohippi]
MRLFALFVLFLLSAACVVSQTVPTNGLVAYYPFSGNANDQSGNGNHGVLESVVGGSLPSLTTDRFGNAASAYKFGGFNNPNWIRVANNSALRFSSAKSISFWMLINTNEGASDTNCYMTLANNGVGMVPISKGGDGECYTPSGWRIQTTLTNGTLKVDYTNTNEGILMLNNNCLTNYNCYSINQWIHCVYTLSSDRKQKLYINGVLYQGEGITKDAATSFAKANLADLIIGRIDTLDDPTAWNRYRAFSGKIDDIAIYNRELTYDEVRGLYGRYVDPLATENTIHVSGVDVVNPCGQTMGTITFNTRPQSGVTYKYSLSSTVDVQSSNVLRAGPGTYHCYIVSDCGLWDTVITLQCDCASDPSLTSYDTVCPHESGTRGSIVTIADHNFEGYATQNKWTKDGFWDVGSGEDNYIWMGLDDPNFRAHGGSRAYFCSNLQTGSMSTSFPSTTSDLISTGINIQYDPSRVPITLSFYYFASAFSSTLAGNCYNTVKLYYATTGSGPWNQLWTSGGGSVPSWTQASVSLSALPSSGTYYFKIECSGNGYCAGFDDFKIVADPRVTIPPQVTNANFPVACRSEYMGNGLYTYYYGDSTVREERVLENTGLCPVTEVKLWYIKPVTVSEQSVTSPLSYTWNGRTYNTDGVYQKTGLRNHWGCDSTAKLNLHIALDNTGDTFATACDNFTWYGETFYRSTQVEHNVGLNQYGGDSIVTLHLTLSSSYYHDSLILNCGPYRWYSELVERDTVVSRKFMSVGGCDSVIHRRILIFEDDEVVVDDSVCEGDLYLYR